MAVEFNATFEESEGLNATFAEPTALNASVGEVMQVVTDDYTDLQNKPSINGVTLIGDKSLSDLDAIDSTLTESGKAADAKVVGDALATKAEIDGYYDEMAVGSAEQLISTVLSEDTEPYTYRTTGGSADVGTRMNLKQVTGGTVAWNQLIDPTTGESGTNSGITFVKNADNSWTLNGTVSGTNVFRNIDHERNEYYMTVGHVYYMPKGTDDPRTIGISLFGMSTRINSYVASHRVFRCEGYTTSYECTYCRVQVRDLTGETLTNVVVKPQIYDLTLMFGSAIADYVLSIHQAKTGAGEAWLKKYLPDVFAPYNAGELVSVQTSGRETVGFNQLDPDTGTVEVFGGKQYQITGSFTALTLNGETVTPDSSGLFTPSADGTLTVTGAGSDTCLHFVHSGYRNGEYEPYEKHTYPLSPVTLRGIPKLSNGAMVYDGDSYTPDGTVTRRYGVRAYQAGDATDGSTMITDGINTVYELATPTTETADPYHEIQIVDDFGTERFLDAPIPVGTVSEYQANLRDKLQHLPDLATNDGIYAIQQTGQQMTLVPVTTPTELPTAPTTDGAYVLRATVSNGVATYTWENAT